MDGVPVPVPVALLPPVTGGVGCVSLGIAVIGGRSEAHVVTVNRARTNRMCKCTDCREEYRRRMDRAMLDNVSADGDGWHHK